MRERGASQGHISEPGILLAEADARRQAKQGCDMLLDRLVAYGMRHDGLPGLPAEQLLALNAGMRAIRSGMRAA